jgi:hypothetical protein
MYEYMAKSPTWKTDTFTLPDAPDEPITYYYHNIIKCALFLIANPTFAECEEFVPSQTSIEANNNKRVCTYHKIMSGRSHSARQSPYWVLC